MKDSKAPRKVAKIWFRTQDYTDVNTDIVLENFLEKIYPNFADLKEVLEKNNGSGYLTLYFTSAKERPIIGLTKKSIELLEKLGIEFEVDFRS